jgi:NhaA family Na+:H+ antiporter
MLVSGVHATVAGVLLAFTIPARPSATPDQFERRLDRLGEELKADRQDVSTPDDPLRNARMTSIAMATERAGATVQSPLQRIEHALAPWVAFVVVPVFALANAGIDISTIRWSQALSNDLTLGVIAGLLAGKFAGISCFCWVAVKAGLGRLPAGVAWRHLLGAAWLAGIGFTMSLFISQLAFVQAEQVEAAKLGILIASCVAAGVGFIWLWLASRSDR